MFKKWMAGAAIVFGGTLGAVLELESTHMVRTMMTDDHKAAAASFVSKTAPVFNAR